jgi:hypothetical protein
MLPLAGPLKSVTVTTLEAAQLAEVAVAEA